MLLSNVQKSIIVMALSTHAFLGKIFEAVQKLAARVLSGLKTARLRLVVLNPDKTVTAAHVLSIT